MEQQGAWAKAVQDHAPALMDGPLFHKQGVPKKRTYGSLISPLIGQHMADEMRAFKHRSAVIGPNQVAEIRQCVVDELPLLHAWHQAHQNTAGLYTTKQLGKAPSELVSTYLRAAVESGHRDVDSMTALVKAMLASDVAVGEYPTTAPATQSHHIGTIVGKMQAELARIVEDSWQNRLTHSAAIPKEVQWTFLSHPDDATWREWVEAVAEFGRTSTLGDDALSMGLCRQQPEPPPIAGNKRKDNKEPLNCSIEQRARNIVHLLGKRTSHVPDTPGWHILTTVAAASGRPLGQLSPGARATLLAAQAAVWSGTLKESWDNAAEEPDLDGHRSGPTDSAEPASPDSYRWARLFQTRYRERCRAAANGEAALERLEDALSVAVTHSDATFSRALWHALLADDILADEADDPWTLATVEAMLVRRWGFWLSDAIAAAHRGDRELRAGENLDEDSPQVNLSARERDVPLYLVNQDSRDNELTGALMRDISASVKMLVNIDPVARLEWLQDVAATPATHHLDMVDLATRYVAMIDELIAENPTLVSDRERAEDLPDIPAETHPDYPFRDRWPPFSLVHRFLRHTAAREVPHDHAH